MKYLFAILWLFMGVALAQGPQIPLTGSVGVKGSVEILGSANVSITDANHTLTANEYASNFLLVTSSVSLTSTRNLVAPLNEGQQLTIENSTTGGHAIQVIGATGTGITIPNGQTVSVTSDGTNYLTASSSGSGTVSAGTAAQQTIYSNNGTTVSGQTKPIYDVRDYGFVDDGSTDNTAATAALIAAIGSKSATIQFPTTTAGQYKIANFRFPSNVTLDFSSGGSISPIKIGRAHV